MKITGFQSVEDGNSEEVSSVYTEKQSTHGIDAVKQKRGLLSFRSRKLLNLFHKNDSVQAEKQSAPASARDVRLEVIANPTEQLSVEPKKQEHKKIVRTVVGQKGTSVLKDRERGKPRKAIDGSSRKVAVYGGGQTQPKQLPARLKLLETFYEGLEAAISLLAIRRQMCTFKSVCKTVEQMSKRRFLRSHLAQLKFLFPEAIDIDYARVPDQDSRRDVWDLRIILKSYPVLPGESPLKGAASPSRDKNAQTLRRKKEFHSRLLKFASSHNEEVDVPQDPLPQRPLGGHSLSSPNVSTESLSFDLLSSSNAGDVKQSSSTTLEAAAASPVNGEDRKDVAENHDAPGEADLLMDKNSEVYEFSIVKPGPGSCPDIDVNSHFPPLFKPHFKERAGELKTMEKDDSVEFLDVGVMSHFASSFKPRFQERQRELLSQTKSSSGTGPSEVHLQTSAISSRTITRFSRTLGTKFLNSTVEERTREDFSEPSASEFSEAQGNFLKSPASIAERPSCSSSSLSSTGELKLDTSARGEEIIADEGDPQVQEVSTLFSNVRSPARNSLREEVLPSSPANEMSSKSRVIMSPVSRRVTETAPDNSHSFLSVSCSTLASSASGTTDSIPNTPQNDGISVHCSPATAIRTPDFLSPSYQYQYVHQYSPVSENQKKSEVSPISPVPVRSQGTMRSLKFGSPIRPPRPSRRQAEELAPSTPELGTSLESTPKEIRKSESYVSTPQATTPEALLGESSYFTPAPRDVSKSVSNVSTPQPTTPEALLGESSYFTPASRDVSKSVSCFSTPQATTPEALLGESSYFTPAPSDASKSVSYVSTPQATTPEASLRNSSYFSPVKPQRSRALRFSTPEKVHDNVASDSKRGTLSSSQQHFKSPQTTTPVSAVRKPPRVLSPPKAETLSAPATPAPQTPVRSVLFSPPKRTKFSRGSLFPNDESEEEEVQVRRTLKPEGQKPETSTDIGCETQGVDFGADALPHIQEEDNFTTPCKTIKALNYVSKSDLAIIDSLPAGLVHSVREKERKIKDENTRELVLQKRRQQMMAGLPKMFNQIRMIFQSLKRSVLPRNELIKNVLSTNPDITDRVEVEERLKLLIELAPDWITKQPSANGDFIYRINKTANVTKTQKKILEAC